MRLSPPILSATLIVFLPLAAWSSDMQTCAAAADAETREAACTVVIRSAPSDPATAWAYSNRCKARHADGRLGGALEDCNSAIRLDPNHWQAWHNRAIVHAKAGRAAKALSDAERVLSLRPSAFGAYLEKANALCRLGRGDAAVRAYRTALRHGVLPALPWQRQLKQQGYYPGALDGLFGPQSRSALLAWASDTCG